MENEIMSEKEKHLQYLLNYCFTALEYIGEIDKKLLKRAKQYAEDSTGVQIDSFELKDVDEIEEDTVDDLLFTDEEETDDE